MRKLKRNHRTKKQKLRYIRLKIGLNKLITNTFLKHKEQVIASILKNNKLAARLIKRFEDEDANC